MGKHRGDGGAGGAGCVCLRNFLQLREREANPGKQWSGIYSDLSTFLMLKCNELSSPLIGGLEISVSICRASPRLVPGKGERALQGDGG